MDLTKLADLTKLEAQVVSLGKRLNEALAVAGKWELTSEGRVYTNDNKMFVEMVFKKQSGKGWVLTLDEETLNKYVADPDSLISRITDEVYDRIYREDIKQHISEFVRKGLYSYSISRKA